jgi:L-amino acid N-acyltransferase YncA
MVGDRYPAELALDGTRVDLRLMSAGDGGPVLEFARSLPDVDLLFLAVDITQPEHVAAWLEGIQRRASTTVLATHDGRVAGFASVERNLVGWTRHVGEVRVIVGEQFRGIGLGQALVREAFHVAVALGVTKMVAHMTLDHQAAIRTFRRFGFETEAVLSGQVVDRGGEAHDLLVMRRATPPSGELEEP